MKTSWTTGLSDRISEKVFRVLRPSRTERFSWFTLAELVIVITVLAVLATLGFVALSGYSQDAKSSVIKANVRSLYSAISSEAAITWNSPRYYVVHDPSAALTGAVSYVDWMPSVLTWGAWNVPGTNYSAWEPDFQKLRLDPSKFRVTATDAAFFDTANAAAQWKIIVWAADLPNWTKRKWTVSYLQVAGVSPDTGSVTIAGNYPQSAWSAIGLVKSPASSEPLVDGAKVGTSVGCASWVTSGYATPEMPHGGSSTVTKAVLSWTWLSVWTRTGNAVCSFASVTVSDSSVSCVGWWVEWPSFGCVQDVCWWTVSDPNAHSTATSQSVSGNWARSWTPGLCTWDCNAWYGWDSVDSVCKPSINWTCWSAAKTYPYSSVDFWSDALCWNGSASSVPSFPSAGGTVNWTCAGQFGGSSSPGCSASRGSCAAAPAFANLWTLTVGNPVSVWTAWSYSATPWNCSYSCAAGYSWTSCLTQSIVGNDTAGRTWADGSHARSCKEYRNGNGNKTYAWAVWDGTYWIDPDGSGGASWFKVLCDMTSDGGGWTIISNSLANATTDSSMPFNASWNSLKTAWVGNMTLPDTNFHISMDRYISMANATNQVEYAWYGKSGKPSDPWQKTIQYSNHYLSNDGYFTWNGTAAYALNSLVAYNGVKLTTYDADNDTNTSGNCASPAVYGSFGWYTSCHAAHIWSQTPEWSYTCAPWAVEAALPGHGYTWAMFVRWGTAVCNGYSNRWPDAAWSYNTWYQLKIMIR